MSRCEPGWSWRVPSSGERITANGPDVFEVERRSGTLALDLPGGAKATVGRGRIVDASTEG